MRRLKNGLIPTRNGGVFLGLNGTVVKSHGRMQQAFQRRSSWHSNWPNLIFQKVAARVASTPTLAQDHTKPSDKTGEQE